MIKRFFIVLLICAAVFSAGAYIALAGSTPSIEDIKKQRKTEGTKIYADDDTLIGEFKVEKGIYVPLKRIPDNLKNAVIAVEDARFWQHKGLDYIGIARALVTDIMHASLKEGGSTITQQLAKILFLSPEKTIKRKLREAQLAIRIEKEMSKNEILELYLNRVYFGHGAYGVEMASKIYFGKSVSRVTLPEAALLAGLIKAPNTYSPYNNLVKAKERQEIVLSRMEEVGYITTAERAQAKSQTLALSSSRLVTEVYNYFLEYIRQDLEQKYGIETIYTGGLKVYTTLNRAMQSASQRALQEGLREVDKRRGWRGPIGKRDTGKKDDGDTSRTSFAAIPGDIATGVVLSVTLKEAVIRARGITGTLSAADAQWAAVSFDRNTGKQRTSAKFSLGQILQKGDIVWVRVKNISGGHVAFALDQEPEVEGALVALEPDTGFIRAMTGGFSPTKSEFNRALYAKRQPGSAFKPFIYAAALENGLTPATVIVDEPVSYPNGAGGQWSPENYDRKHYGTTTLRDALAYSRNVVTVRLAEMTGIGNVISFARETGIEADLPRELTITLGSLSVSPYELAKAYSSFANGGYRIKPITVKYITDAKGKVIESNEPEATTAFSPQTAFLITSMMEDVIRYGTGGRARIGRPAAGKTGTSNDYRDAWFVGYTPELLACVWVGYDDMRRSLGRGEVGGRAAAPIWAGFMRRALSEEPMTNFVMPEGIIRLSTDPATGLLSSDEASGQPEYFREGTQPRGYSSPSRRFERTQLESDQD